MQMLPSTNKRLYQLLNETGLIKNKADLINGFTKGRTSSSKDMTNLEAMELIHYLSSQPNKKGESAASANRMRRKIFALCHKMNWVDNQGNVKIDILNKWCVEKSYLKKELSLYSVQELPKLVNQITQVYQSFLNTPL